MGFTKTVWEGFQLWLVHAIWPSQPPHPQISLTTGFASQHLVETGVVREYNFTLSRSIQNIDCLERNVILVNGEFPGPRVEANFGDTISVTVNNNISEPEEGTALHWHGMLQTGTPWFDGVPGVSQCPIAPGESMTYKFLADQYGTSWYHAHYSAQYAAGIFGPLVIHGPKHVEYDIDLGPLMLHDFYSRYYRDVLKEVLRPRPFPAAPPSDHNLMNGMGDLTCSDSRGTDPCTDTKKLFKLAFTPGRTHRLRLINAGTEGMQRFSIDGYKLTVITADFVPIVPYEADIVTLAVGQRADVLVKVSKDASEPVWMRSWISDICSFTNHHTSHGVAYFNGETKDAKPNSTADPVDDSSCFGESLESLVPAAPVPAAKKPEVTNVINLGNHPNATGQWIWTMNGYVAEANLNDPVIRRTQAGSTSFPVQWNVIDYGEASTVRVIFNNPIAFPHPMHLHGFNYKVLAQDFGEWDGTITNPENPTRRDTQMVPSLGYIVLEMDVDRPGLWPFHCHIGPHLSAGLSVTLMTQPGLLQDLQMPESIEGGCQAWKKAAAKVPSQIDSGLSVGGVDEPNPI